MKMQIGKRIIRARFLLVLVMAVAGVSSARGAELSGDFAWTAGPARVAPASTGGQAWISIKDPSVVRYGNRWHLFCTVRGRPRSHATVYLSFADWKDAASAPQRVLSCWDGYFCAPQVFYFSPQKQWYLICQASSDAWEPKYQPAFATSSNVADPDSWTLQPLGATKPAEARAWLDFWIICDESKAHLFFTSLDGKMWRAETALADFPHGWSRPVLAMQGDIFEAGHSYRLKGQEKYLTLVEAQNGHGWRYYKAYLADRLDGAWTPLAAEKDHAFASMQNVTHPQPPWTDVVSHGELLRAGCDQRLEVDPAHLRFLIQGCRETDRAGKEYGDLPWRLGLLEAR